MFAMDAEPTGGGAAKKPRLPGLSSESELSSEEGSESDELDEESDSELSQGTHVDHRNSSSDGAGDDSESHDSDDLSDDSSRESSNSEPELLRPQRHGRGGAGARAGAGAGAQQRGQESNTLSRHSLEHPHAFERQQVGDKESVAEVGRRVLECIVQAAGDQGESIIKTANVIETTVDPNRAAAGRAAAEGAPAPLPVSPSRGTDHLPPACPTWFRDFIRHYEPCIGRTQGLRAHQVEGLRATRDLSVRGLNYACGILKEELCVPANSSRCFSGCLVNVTAITSF